MDDAISRSELIRTLDECVDTVEKQEHKSLLFAFGEFIKSAPALDVVPVAHEKDIHSSIVTVENVDEWQDRIILADESTRVCSVYYAEDDECMHVVRCNDCTWFNHGYCMRFDDDVMPDDFCSRGHTET